MFVRVHYDKRVASLEPLGLEYLVACVKAEKHRAFIFDESIVSPFMRFKQLLNKVDKNGVTVVGFTVMSNMAWYILELIRKLKKARPWIKVIVGGPEVNINYKDFCLDDNFRRRRSS